MRVWVWQSTDDDALQKVTPREFKPRISRTKGHLSKRTAFVREIVKEVSGYVFSSASQPAATAKSKTAEHFRSAQEVSC